MDLINLIIYFNDGVKKISITKEMANNITDAVRINKSEKRLREYFANLEDEVSGEKVNISLDDIQGFEFVI